jgi:hypothetical protein
MTLSKTMRGALALAFLMGGMATASAQGMLDRMKEDAQRRAENKAVMDAEHPQDTKAAMAPAAAAPSTTAAPADPASSQPAPAAPATPATPAPAQ